jgi:hypothetical protein
MYKLIWNFLNLYIFTILFYSCFRAILTYYTWLQSIFYFDVEKSLK